MDASSENCPSPRYRAFISYSHADARFAGWLHRRLERFRTAPGERLAPIFIDRAELAAGPDLSAQVRSALADSAALVVLCSPSARASRWVAQEIALFRELHPGRPILAALVAGEPAEAFPELLTRHGDETLEPLAADFRDRRDGRRLGLIKIAAGLTAQPLDRLVQRDAQQRTRRVMWITAAAVLLSLVLAALLVLALRARSEAQRQRAEAEGLVEFMLTDLRDKLKGVGRLDVMDAVNERAMAHYADGDSASLPDDIVLRRAKLQLAMGEDNIDTVGGRQRGERDIAAAWTTTAALLAKAPRDPERVFQHAQSEYWMGYVAFSRRVGGAQGPRDFAGAYTHWQAYARLAQQLAALQPRNPRSPKENAYARGALCGLQLERGSAAPAALADCRAARQSLEQAIALEPANRALRIDLANRLAWEAQALEAAGQLGQAAAQRRAQVALTAELSRSDPQNAEVTEADMLANMGLAALLDTMQQGAAARAAWQRAGELSERLVKHDPANRNWRGWHRQILDKLTAKGA